MSGKSKKAEYISTGLVAQNRRAHFDYLIEDTFIAGLVLTGTEVKSLRLGHANINEAYGITENNELYMSNMFIAEYINKGYYVILDRYVTSNLAHQGCKIEDKDERFYMYQWIDKLEYWLLELPKPDITIFLHVPYDFTKELVKNRENLDDYEKSPEYLKNAERAYVELSQLYNWDVVECVKDNRLRSIEDIGEEIYSIITK